MNIRSAVEQELVNIVLASKKHRNLLEVIYHVIQISENKLALLRSRNSIEGLVDVLTNIAATKDSKLVIHGLHLVQKLSQGQFIMQDHLSVIINFFNACRPIQDDTLQIKLVSTLLHIIEPSIIDLNTKDQFLDLLQLFLKFYTEDNPIIQQSAIQGVITLIGFLEHGQTVLLQLLDIFLNIILDQPQEYFNIQGTTILCKDIFIMLLKMTKPIAHIPQIINIYKQVYTHCSQMELLGEQSLLNRIHKIRLVFTYMHLVEDQYDLLHRIIKIYLKLSIFDLIKIVIHDGLLFLLSNQNIFNQLFLRTPSSTNCKGIYNHIQDYMELILKVIYDNSLSCINEYKVQSSPKQANTFQQVTVQQFDMKSQNIPVHFVMQAKSLLLLNIEQLVHLNLIDYEHVYKIEQKEERPILAPKMVQSVQVEPNSLYKSKTEDLDDVYTEIDVDQSHKFKYLLENIWKPQMKLLKQLMKLSQNGEQYTSLLEILLQWLKLTWQFEHKTSFEQLIRFLSQQATPNSQQMEEGDKCLQAYRVLCDYLPQKVDNLSARTWNFIFQTLQRIEQVAKKDQDISFTTELFVHSQSYSNVTVLQMIDALNQLCLQVSERLQINNKRQQFDNVYKSFALDKLVILVTLNWGRVEIFWHSVEALILCIAGSRVVEMRLNAINCLKDLMYSGSLYEHVVYKRWADNLLNPLTELLQSNHEDVVENTLHILNTFTKGLTKTTDVSIYAVIVKVLEQAIMDILQKIESQPESQHMSKSLFMRLVLSINCLTELIFNMIESLDNSSLMRLASLVVSLNKQQNCNRSIVNHEIHDKIICMVWQVQLRMLALGLANPQLYIISLDLAREQLDSEDLRFAALHIVAQFCLTSPKQEYLELLEDVSQQIFTNYLKLELQYYQLTQQTPRFIVPVMETPKFVQFSRQLLDKASSVTTNYQTYQDLSKIAIVKITQVIIQKKLYSKYLECLSLFSQAQHQAIKNELVLSINNVLADVQDKSINEQIIDFLSAIVYQQDKEDPDICQFYIENDTFNNILLIIVKLLNQGENIFSLLKNVILNYNQVFQYTAQDAVSIIMTEDKHILRFFQKECLPLFSKFDDQWLDFVIDLFNTLIKSHQGIIQYLCQIFEYFLSKCKEIQVQLNKGQQYILLLKQFRSNANQMESKIETQITNHIRQILLILTPHLDHETVMQIIGPFIDNQNDLDWIKFIITELIDKIDNEHQYLLLDLIADHYRSKLQSSESLYYVMNIITTTQSTFSDALALKIQNDLYQAIDMILKTINKDNLKQELLYNVLQILNYLQGVPPNKIIYQGLLNLIRIEKIEIRELLIQILQKYE